MYCCICCCSQADADEDVAASGWSAFTACGHVLHTVCLLQAIAHNSKCPKCKAVVRRAGHHRIFYDEAPDDEAEAAGADAAPGSVADLSEEARRLQRRLQSTESQLQSLRETLAMERQQRSAAEAQLEALANVSNAQVSRLQQELEGSRTAYRVLQTKNKQLDNKARNLENDFKLARLAASRLNIKYDDSLRGDRLEAELELMRAEGMDPGKFFLQQLDSRNRQIRDVTNELQRCRREKEVEIQRERAELQGKLAEVQHELEGRVRQLVIKLEESGRQVQLAMRQRDEARQALEAARSGANAAPSLLAAAAAAAPAGPAAELALPGGPSGDDDDYIVLDSDDEGSAQAVAGPSHPSAGSWEATLLSHPLPDSRPAPRMPLRAASGSLPAAVSQGCEPSRWPAAGPENVPAGEGPSSSGAAAAPRRPGLNVAPGKSFILDRSKATTGLRDQGAIIRHGPDGKGGIASSYNGFGGGASLKRGVQTKLVLSRAGPSGQQPAKKARQGSSGGLTIKHFY